MHVQFIDQNRFVFLDDATASDDSYGAPAGDDNEEYAYDDYSTDAEAAADSYAAADEGSKKKQKIDNLSIYLFR